MPAPVAVPHVFSRVSCVRVAMVTVCLVASGNPGPDDDGDERSQSLAHLGSRYSLLSPLVLHSLRLQYDIPHHRALHSSIGFCVSVINLAAILSLLFSLLLAVGDYRAC